MVVPREAGGNGVPGQGPEPPRNPRGPPLALSAAPPSANAESHTSVWKCGAGKAHPPTTHRWSNAFMNLAPAATSPTAPGASPPPPAQHLASADEEDSWGLGGRRARPAQWAERAPDRALWGRQRAHGDGSPQRGGGGLSRFFFTLTFMCSGGNQRKGHVRHFWL